MLHIGSRKREKAMGKNEPNKIKKEILRQGKFHPGKNIFTVHSLQ